MSDVVKTSTRLWSTECAIADAVDVLDGADAGIVAIEKKRPYPAYQFSNGRKFVNPYPES